MYITYFWFVFVLQGDFNDMPFEDACFDKAYAIEATCHAPDVSKVYGEVFRTLKPGGLFSCWEWIVTDKYDPSNKMHRHIIDGILVSNITQNSKA